MTLPKQNFPEQGIQLPEPPAAVGHYAAAVRHGRWLFISRQLQFSDGRLIFTGKLGRDLDAQTGYQAAQQCALNVLGQIRRVTGSLDSVVGLARVEGYLNSAEDFRDHASVLDGASDLFRRALGERGVHARAVYGVTSLPFDAAVKLAVTAAVIMG